jgi:hypothetical protein
MTPDDWANFQSERKLTQKAACALVGISQGQHLEYTRGTKPTPRKVALAVSAVAMGLPPYGGKIA